MIIGSLVNFTIKITHSPIFVYYQSHYRDNWVPALKICYISGTAVGKDH